MERVKSWLLAFLVALSLVQSFLLAYSIPGISTTVRTEQDYVNTEPMGAEQTVEDVIFPEQIVLHFGNGKHTVMNAGDLPYYSSVYDKLKNREFTSFQKMSPYVVDWKEIRSANLGLELSFGSGIPVELLRKVMKLQGNQEFMADSVDRIWIFRSISGSGDEVRTFFFSSGGQAVYESKRADLSVQDVEDDVGLGAYLTPYAVTEDGLYVPQEPVEAAEAIVGYDAYPPDLMQRNLFFDPGTTRTLKDRSGSQVYTDGKHALQVEQDGEWIRYTDPAAPQNNEQSGSAGSNVSSGVVAAVVFINQHGGWDGRHQLQSTADASTGIGKSLLFGQYFRLDANRSFPILPGGGFRFGYMKLTAQQSVVTGYERSLITLSETPEAKVVRWLPGGTELQKALGGFSRRAEVQALFPAVKAEPLEHGKLRFDPVWVVRLSDGTRQTLTGALPAGFDGSAYKKKLSGRGLLEGTGPLSADNGGASGATTQGGSASGGNPAGTQQGSGAGEAPASESGGSPDGAQ
ncbi:YycH family regulatory protein [Paenibacillus beijingensis]|uniref:YycH family regulatory protein n=1 Tax=Paenibacillus beijingensis TaxID=1126833 RepID=UPI0006967703|nr:two-component system activity regulator YycH [Paenibacillus beijingensis]